MGKPIISSEKILHMDYDLKVSVAKSLVVILKGLGAWKNSLALNC
jgi:hypothetical protein